MGVNSIRADNLSPVVLMIIILNKTEVNISGQLLRVCSSGLILLIHGHFVTFISVQDLSPIVTSCSHKMFEQTKRDIANFSYIWYNLTLLSFTWE